MNSPSYFPIALVLFFVIKMIRSLLETDGEVTHKQPKRFAHRVESFSNNKWVDRPLVKHYEKLLGLETTATISIPIINWAYDQSILLPMIKEMHEQDTIECQDLMAAKQYLEDRWMLVAAVN